MEDCQQHGTHAAQWILTAFYKDQVMSTYVDEEGIYKWI